MRHNSRGDIYNRRNCEDVLMINYQRLPIGNPTPLEKIKYVINNYPCTCSVDLRIVNDELNKLYAIDFNDYVRMLVEKYND